METFTKLKDFTENPDFYRHREEALNRLDIRVIDAPVVGLIRDFAKLSYCFTLQSCYGHFLYDHQKNPGNLDPLPRSGNTGAVDYRIAYIALCLQNSESGKKLFNDLKKLTSIDPAYVQFGCAEWFWKRQVNSYALQIEPERYMAKDRVVVDYEEALHIEEVRNRVFSELKKMVREKALLE